MVFAIPSTWHEGLVELPAQGDKEALGGVLFPGQILIAETSEVITDAKAHIVRHGEPDLRAHAEMRAASVDRL